MERTRKKRYPNVKRKNKVLLNPSTLDLVVKLGSGTQIIERGTSARENPALYCLTTVERAIVRMVIDGHIQAEISKKMGMRGDQVSRIIRSVTERFEFLEKVREMITSDERIKKSFLDGDFCAWRENR